MRELQVTLGRRQVFVHDFGAKYFTVFTIIHSMVERKKW